MPETCPRGFDETLLSGAIDHELVQADAQKVRIHLEDCAFCRAQFDELTRLREVAMSTNIRQPPDDQWREAPRGGISTAGRTRRANCLANTPGPSCWMRSTKSGWEAAIISASGPVSAGRLS